MGVVDPEQQATPTETDPLTGGARRASSDYGGPNKATFWSDVRETCRLAFPIFVTMLSSVGMKTTDSALLGHVSTDALSAAALSDLWTMCTASLLQARVLNTVIGPAIAAKNLRMAGIYLQVSLYVLGILSVFVFIAWNLTDMIWIALGSDRHISRMAGYYARVTALGLPGHLAFGQLSQFFASQRILYPEVIASAVALVTNVGVGYILVRGIPYTEWDGYGFTACPIVTTLVVYVQLFVVWFFFMYLQKLHVPAWGGWDYQAISWGRIKAFSEVYFPAAFGLASDFWRVAVVGTVAAKMGEEEVAVFNTSYRVMWIVLVMTGAISSAAGINTTQRLGQADHLGAKQAAHVGVWMSAALLLVVGLFVPWKIRWFGKIFSNNERILDLFEETKWPFTTTLVLMNLAVAIERIPYSLGRTKEVFWLGFVASWLFQVPGVLVLTRFWRNDLVGLYSGMCIGYIALVLLYSGVAFTTDWKVYAKLSRRRAEVELSSISKK